LPSTVSSTIEYSITCASVESLTSSRRPSGDRPMWSVRKPSICCSRTMLSAFPAVALAKSIQTTSAKLGRETATYLPSLVVNMSSTYWSCPSPGPCWIKR
jgi:hypothetical protein